MAAFADRGISGAALANRPGVQTLLREAERGEFDVVLTEALDRLSRDQEGAAHLYKRLSYHGVRLETLSEGAISELHVGLNGTMNQLFLAGLAKKTRRGLVARVKSGHSAGGRCYGYEVVEGAELRIHRLRHRRRAGPANPRRRIEVFGASNAKTPPKRGCCRRVGCGDRI